MEAVAKSTGDNTVSSASSSTNTAGRPASHVQSVVADPSIRLNGLLSIAVNSASSGTCTNRAPCEKANKSVAGPVCAAAGAARASATIIVPRYFISRSEEHTSELQSLMRISYAVFCLKKKNEQPITNNT